MLHYPTRLNKIVDDRWEILFEAGWYALTWVDLTVYWDGSKFKNSVRNTFNYRINTKMLHNVDIGIIVLQAIQSGNHYSFCINSSNEGRFNFSFENEEDALMLKMSL